jgi:hypothetical protein
MIKCTILKNKYTCIINTEILTYTYNKENIRKFFGIGKYRTKILASIEDVDVYVHVSENKRI